VTKTQATYQDELRDRLDEASAAFWTNKQIQRWLNQAVRDIARKTEWLRSRDSQSVVPGTQEYTTPLDAIRIHRAEYVRTGDNQVYPLEYRDWNAMDNVWWTQQTITSQTPAFWTMWGAVPNLSVALYPIPSTAGTLKLFYYKAPAELAVDDSDAAVVLEVPEGWEDLVLQFAEYCALRKDSDPRWQEAKALYDENLADLYTTAIRFTDQAGQMVYDVGVGGLPGWLVGGEGY